MFQKRSISSAFLTCCVFDLAVFVASLMPFSGGVRACPGEALAKERVMTFASAILRNFRLDCDEQTQPSSDPRDFQLGLILEPKPFKVRFTPI